MNKLDELLDTVDAALYAWESVKAQLPDAEELIEQGKWILHYAKTKGWYL